MIATKNSSEKNPPRAAYVPPPQLPPRYVQLAELLRILFDDSCRPSIRWGREHYLTWPFVRIGHLVFFDPEVVKMHFDAKASRTTR